MPSQPVTKPSFRQNRRRKIPTSSCHFLPPGSINILLAIAHDLEGGISFWTEVQTDGGVMQEFSKFDQPSGDLCSERSAKRACLPLASSPPLFTALTPPDLFYAKLCTLLMKVRLRKSGSNTAQVPALIAAPRRTIHCSAAPLDSLALLGLPPTDS